MFPPVLLRDHPPALRVLLPIVGPVLTGAIGGWLLGRSSAAYLIYVTAMILGGIFTGMEHTSVRGGALRGVLGGALFATSILVTNELLGEQAQATLPDPPALIVPVYAVFGTLFGMLGARLRRRWAPAP